LRRRRRGKSHSGDDDERPGGVSPERMGAMNRGHSFVEAARRAGRAWDVLGRTREARRVERKGG